MVVVVGGTLRGISVSVLSGTEINILRKHHPLIEEPIIVCGDYSGRGLQIRPLNWTTPTQLNEINGLCVCMCVEKERKNLRY